MIMKNVKCKYGQFDNLSATPIDNGTIYVCKDTLDTFVDLDNNRLQLSSNVSCNQKLVIEVITEQEYNNLSTIDENTLYIIKG